MLKKSPSTLFDFFQKKVWKILYLFIPKQINFF